MDTAIADLYNIKTGGGFSTYIDYIRFPYFKNMMANARIDFEFPLTVLIGKNGSGKSSVLHALYGAPKGQSVGDFWFATNTDPIMDSVDGERPSFIYAYTQDGKSLEVLKTRIKKTGNPDYWEPSRPLAKLGMELQGGKRNDPIKMNVLYRNFRTGLSSFDKYFYYNLGNNPQPYLRNRSKYLKRAMSEDLVINGAYGHPQNSLRYIMSSEELQIVSEILGKDYEAGTIIRHKYFKEWGYSVLFGTKDLKYSEAFAGSGELSAAMIVHEVLQAPESSLILLDEPEISLHPGAQAKLKKFLLNQIKFHKHQIVISTHSPSFVADLPPNAIKVFSTSAGGKSSVARERLPEEAFYEIGVPTAATKTIYTEDRLAAEVLKSVINELGEDTSSIFGVNHVPGGISSVYDYAAKHVGLNSADNIWIILDGDQQKVFCDPNLIPIGEKTIEGLRAKIKNAIGHIPKFYLDSDNEQLQIDTYFNFLEFLYKKVRFLPALTPEELIWSDEVAAKLLDVIGEPSEKVTAVLSELSAITNYKTKFVNLTEKVKTANAGVLATVHSMFIKNWINGNDDDKAQVVADISSIRDQVI